MTTVGIDYPPTARFDQWYGLPKGDACCKVTSFAASSLSLPEKWQLTPARDQTNRIPVLTTLIRHPSGKLALFDLGLTKHWQSFLAPEEVSGYDFFEVTVDKNMDEVLVEGGVKPEDIELIVLSHRHFDHTGDPSLFPNAKVIVGPNERDEVKALVGHKNVQELSWHASPTRIAAFEHSYDVWGDGSFLITSAPGHTSGHLAALVRTSPHPSAGADKGEGEYVLLAADCCHHGALLFDDPSVGHYTLGHWREPGEPLDEVPKHSNYDDWPLSSRTLERAKACQRQDEIMVVLAHNADQWEKWGSGKGTWGVELNDWRKRGLK
ncbi:hypothetical protein JCM10213_004026 [Rhodosporidiobolus nylandii]